MIIYKDLEQFNSEGTAVTVGKFDGVHAGHRMLLETLLKNAGDLEPCVFTFDIPENGRILKNDHRICTEQEKENILESLGIKKLILFPFNEKNAATEAESFVEDILVRKLKCKLLVVGDDFRFGKDRAGDTELLKKLAPKLGFELIVVKREEFEGSPISSSRIREEISKKNVEKVRAMLGK